MLSGKRRVTIVAGHQAELWHPGILAKYFAADAAARALSRQGVDAGVTWLFVDQDSNDPSKIAYPARSNGGLTKATWRVPFKQGGSLSGFSEDTPTASLPTLLPPDMRAAVQELSPATASVRDGLVRIAEVMRRHAGEPNAARQLAAVVVELLAPLVQPRATLFASELDKTELFAELVEKIRADPLACSRAYNDAVAHEPHAHMRPLEVGARIELPLWRMPTAMGMPRRRVFADDLASVPMTQLAPRALLMTALVRLAQCDMLIHGIGGGIYDKATEAWMSTWLPERRLAPTSIVTATRTLKFEGSPPRTPEAIAHAVWKAHHGLHDPAMLGDGAASDRKRELLRKLRTARANGHEPVEAFQELHQLLARVRAEHAAALARLREEESQARADRAKAQVVFERTWPFPLYEAGQMAELKAEIDGAFGVGG
jgi:hypothetical protein